MSKSLMAAHKEIQYNKVKREVTKTTENKVIPRVQAACLAATALVLHDKFGFGAKRLNVYIAEVFEIFESIYLEYTSFEDIKKCIYDVLGIDFETLERQKEQERAERE